MKQFCVYILKCSDNSYYTGYTSDIEARLVTHELGLIESCYTYIRRPVKIVYTASFSTKNEAFCAERQIKGWSNPSSSSGCSKKWH